MKKGKNLLTVIIALLLIHNLLNAQGKGAENEVISTRHDSLVAMGNKFITMLNTDDVEEAEDLTKQLFVPEALDGLAGQLRTEYGAIEKASIRVMPDERSFHVVAWVSKLKAWRNFQLGLTDEAPYLGRRLAVVLAAPPVDLPEGTINNPEVIKALDAYIDQLASEEGLTASILINKGNTRVIERVVGFANREKKRKNTIDTPFNLASCGKLFTSVAILRLVEKGLISLDDPLIKFLPDYPDEEFARKVRVRHLLTHTSGLGDYWDDEYEKNWGEISALKDYLPFVTGKPLHHKKPGSRGIYSNSGFILLGLIIEAATGGDYFEHIKATIFDPLDMNGSGFFKKHQDDLFAVGYFDFAPGEGMRARGGLMGSAAGGAYATTADMLKFRNALVNHRLIGERMLKEATTKQIELEGGGVEYGLGFVVNGLFKPGFGHGGQGPGSGVTFDIGAKNGYTVMIFANSLNGAYSELLFTLTELCARK